jgi:hypothetical protein
MPPQTNSKNNEEEHHREPSRIVDDNSSAAHPMLLADEAKIVKAELSKRKMHRVGSFFGALLIVILLVALGGVYINRVKINDWYRLRGYSLCYAAS